MEVLTGLSQSIASEISSIENRQRKRSDDAQTHFKHAIECLVKELVLFAVRFFPTLRFQIQRLLQNPFVQAILFRRLWRLVGLLLIFRR